MSKQAKQEYMELVTYLLNARVKGTTDDEEAGYVDRLDALWMAMSEAERDEAEMLLNITTPEEKEV